MENQKMMMMMPPGYRFYPTEEELVGFYLSEKLRGRRQNQLQNVIPVLDIYDYNPWDLPKLSGAQCRQDPQLQEWFFFIPRQEKEARGGRPNRLTENGYWKATGSPCCVYSSDRRIIGEKRTMVFYKGRAPGSKTDWKMNEYRVVDHVDANCNLVLRHEFSICRVYIRSKCIRSYDRRPSSSSSSSSSWAPKRGPPSSSSSMVVDHQHPSITLSSCHQQNPPLVIHGDRTGSSRENSSSSDDKITYNDDEHMSKTIPNDGSNNLGISDMDFNMSDEALLEWEQFMNSTEWMAI